VLLAIAAVAAGALMIPTIAIAWKATQRNVNQPSYVAMGRFVEQNLPDNAALLIDEQVKLERNTAMFRTGRTCYELGSRPWWSMGVQVIKGGGRPYVVSWRPLPLDPIFVDHESARTLYQWTPVPPATQKFVGRLPGSQ
jgi:hypothetical protein